MDHETDFLPECFPASARWHTTDDGFSLCGDSLADLLTARGIAHTGISELNRRDVWSYYDDWYLYRVTGEETVWSLVKLREQEYDYMPGYSDGDYPGVAVSFISFDIGTFLALPDGADAESTQMAAFVEAFRRVTEYPGQTHSPVLQQYFSRESAQAPYLIAGQYLRKLAATMHCGVMPFPAGLYQAPHRIAEGIAALNARAGRTICDFENHCIQVADPEALTPEEGCILLAAHCGNLSMNSFAAEIKFHADALVSWENQIPGLGRTKWYASALRADMWVEHDSAVRKLFFDSYHRLDSPAVQLQAEIHGER